MSSSELKLYRAAGSPSARRVRIVIAKKGLDLPLGSVDLGEGEQHSNACRAMNPQRVMPTLVLPDGTATGEIPASWRYLEQIYPDKPLLGATATQKAAVTTWERRVELEGFVAVKDVRNPVAGLKVSMQKGLKQFSAFLSVHFGVIREFLLALLITEFLYLIIHF
jgi:glutathione S-transferase